MSTTSEETVPRKYPLSSPPVPYLESDIAPGWQKEPWDVNLPDSPGFITDLVWATRGTESTTKFSVWSAIFIISSLLKRDAWLPWIEGSPMFPNMYILFVAPPRVCAKSTAVKFAEKSLRKVESVETDPVLKYLKSINSHHGKATPEVLYDILEPEEKEFELEDGSILPVDRGSQVALIQSELGTFINKSKYNQTLVSVMTKWYDSDDKDDEATRGNGRKSLRNIYVTLFGATTPDAMKDDLPEEVIGGGFLSRCLIISEEQATRYYPLPVRFKGAPDHAELGQRLLWIADNCQGPFTLSKEALQVYNAWYRRFKDSLHVMKSDDINMRARMDTNLIKLAMIIRAQRYEPGMVITKEDFEYAIKLIDEVYQTASPVLDEVGGTEDYQSLSHVRTYIQRNGSVNRKKLLLTFQKKIGIVKLDNILVTLKQRGEVIFKDKNKADIPLPEGDPGEVYKWIGT